MTEDQIKQRIDEAVQQERERAASVIEKKLSVFRGISREAEGVAYQCFCAITDPNE